EPLAPPAAEGAEQEAYESPGRIPTGYRIIRQIGSGGMGAVYEAEDVSLQRLVAIKRMRDEIRLDPRECERFLAEARTVAKLKHENIIEIYHIIENEGEVYLVFELLDGRTLDGLLCERRRLPLDYVRAALRQICAALGYAHERGVIHRDLKPSNIMITKEGRVKVMDFGVARQTQDAMNRLSMTGAVAGTPPYMAPESETGVIRKESDLYSLAILLYETLCGELPFSGTGAGILLTKLNMSYEPLSRRVQGLPPGIDAFFARALHSDPERRPRTAAEFAAAFEEAAAAPPKAT
ncbi:MAG: serine/threonine protein kinase, partial [Elusimicrobia bacterium]|nr:serine/threonine protein kinase [Elusimicrobiota bacterium]